MATFNVIEAAVRLGVGRVVHVSSETVPGFFFAERPFALAYAPVDEEHPATAQDPYALANHFGEQLCDAAVARSDVRCISVRPSWVRWEGNVESNLGPLVARLPGRGRPAAARGARAPGARRHRRALRPRRRHPGLEVGGVPGHVAA